MYELIDAILFGIFVIFIGSAIAVQVGALFAVPFIIYEIMKDI